MTHQTSTIGDTIYFYFAANDTSGSGIDGSTPVFDVRRAGDAASAIPLLSGAATLLTHANYPAGLHEVAIAATVGNGFAADDTFAVFVTLLADAQNPSGFVGTCTLTPLAKASDTADIQARLPSVLVGGRMDSDMGAKTGNVALSSQEKLDVNAEADTALTDYGANTTVPLAAASTATAAAQTTAQNDLDILTGVDGAVLATLQPNYAPAKAGDNMNLVNDAITAAKIATDAIGSLELAADAVQEIVDGMRQQVLTEGYAADGSPATQEQILYMILAVVSEFSISGTTITTKKLDGVTTAMTHTLDSGTDPTSRTRAT